MPKKFSKRKMRNRGKSSRRRQGLRVDPMPTRTKRSQTELNRDVIAKLEAQAAS